jgi:hypothetical protein
LLGIGLGAIEVLLLIGGGGDEPLRSSIAFLILAVFHILYGIYHKQPWVGNFSTGFGSLGLIFLLGHYNQSDWLAPMTSLVLLYYIGGLVPELLQKPNNWSKMVKYSGLGLGILVALSAPAQGGPASYISVAIIATLFAIEAFRYSNVWLAIPADLLYLGAYFMILIDLEIDQPQYYSIGAAILGIVMHYLLVRSGSKLSAFIAGMLSQLALLSTSYIQMISTGESVYFFILFFQSLIVLAYGLVIRSRSLVITPIVFVILGVLTVMFSNLNPLFSLIIIGCSGFLLLLLGIAALFMRENLLETRDKLKERISDWQA